MADKIYQIEDRVIRAKAKRVINPKSSRIRQLVIKMTRVMHSKSLVGIAAPQIGASKRVFITHPRSTKFRKRSEGKILVFINPRILKRSKEVQIGFEGCGSVAHAGIFGKVPRSKTITIRAQDQNGGWFTMNTSGFLTRIIQHEYDHLEGVVFLDRVKDANSVLSRSSYLQKSKK